MKICAIICEYNPFHNGHLYQLRQAKSLSGADAVVCLMSGNFVQRGESAILDKYARAKHAILGGADVVVELPVPYATANAELFARGAIRILSSIPDVTHLCFGAENADEGAFYRAAKLLLNEPKEVSETIKRLVGEGTSYAKARAEAFADRIPSELLRSPNNVLGLEYAKAILAERSAIRILPVERVGGGYRQTELSTEYSSASAIRAALEANDEITGHVPDFVLRDLTQAKNVAAALEIVEKYALLVGRTSNIAKVCDCTEGLENALFRAAKEDAPLVQTLTSARYTSSRIRRIALHYALGVDENLQRRGLETNLYARVLAVNKTRKDVLSAVSAGATPLLLRAHDEDVLRGAARDCYEADMRAESVFKLLRGESVPEKNIFI